MRHSQEFFIVRSCLQQMKVDSMGSHELAFRDVRYQDRDLISEEIRYLQMLASWVAFAIENGERFCVPLRDNLIDGKPWKTYADLVRLPFPAIAIFSEGERSFVNGQSDIRSQVEIAIDAKHARAAGLKGSTDINADVIVASASRPFLENSGAYRWIVDFAGGGFRMNADAASGVHIVSVGPTETVDRENMWKMRMTHVEAAAAGVANLCVMLNLANVSTNKISPDEKFNAKQVRSNLLPLQSYKVLTIDGEVWGRHESNSLGSGKRSHMRRGHIRRLDEHRHVWVRATSVRGSRPGIIHKVYKTPSI